MRLARNSWVLGGEGRGREEGGEGEGGEVWGKDEER